MVGVGISSTVALAGAKIEDRVGDDLVSADLAAIGFVLAATELAFDADMRALPERSGVLVQFGPRLDAIPFGPFLAFAVLHERGLGGERESRDGLPTLGCFHFGMVAEEANEFNAIEAHFFFSFCAHLSRATKSERSPLPAEGT
jgi:hypothetical protein